MLEIDDKAWEAAEVAQVDIINWPDVEDLNPIPDMKARLLYNEYGIFVNMQTDEEPLLATKRKQNDAVCTDSCMEFFIRPNENNPKYFNIEFNPFGTMNLGFRSDRFDRVDPVETKKDFHVQSEVGEKIWTLQFVLPFELIHKYFDTHTDTMYANIYKCGNKKHYASYYPVKTEKPDYHRPEFFGKFVLEK